MLTKEELREPSWLVAGIVMVFAMCLGFVACGESDQEHKASKNYDPTASLDVGTVQHNGYTYNCIKYGRAGQGGLWCDRISGP